jgi:hypothetical protein
MNAKGLKQLALGSRPQEGKILGKGKVRKALGVSTPVGSKTEGKSLGVS